MPEDRRRRQTLLGLAALAVSALLVSALLDRGPGDPAGSQEIAAPVTEVPDDRPDPAEEEQPPESELFRTELDAWADPAGFTEPYPNAALEGLLTFRGNPSRSYYGTGPVPRSTPEILLRYPDAAMCRSSDNMGETKVWCGMGWTGQPLVFDRDGRRWVVFGAYDGAVHFMDGLTGEDILPSVPTGDLIKGTGTVDPDGHPLLYIGSRDDYLRVVAFDRAGEPEVLWKLHAYDHEPTLWNNDWDSSPIVIGDHLLVGGENSRWYVIELNRGYGPDGLVTVDPEVVFTAPSWDDELLAALPDRTVSVESSLTVVGDTVYFGNSGGLVQGWDLGGVRDGSDPERVFRFWTGDDTDATVVADDDGHLYVGVQWERGLDRAREVGQLVKLDPDRADDPVVWSVEDIAGSRSGIWGTPGIWEDTVYVGTDGGRLLGVDRATGELRWEKRLPGPLWGSPVVVDGVLLIGDCAGSLHAYDVADTSVDPPELWSLELGGCIEATPAVWDGRIYLGTRAGHLVVIGDPAHQPEVPR